MIQFISHYNEKYTYLDSIRLALDGGCKWIQLRMKKKSPEEIMPIALEVQKMCREAGATFIIDDHVALVKEIHADGVHLGKNDMSIHDARELLGPDYIIGGTANTFEDLLAHYKAGANYIGCGPFRFTTTKENLSPILGVEGYKNIIEQMKRHSIAIPIVAIGGITIEDIPDIMQTGISGIALSGSILRADDPIKTMQEIIEITEKYKNKQVNNNIKWEN